MANLYDSVLHKRKIAQLQAQIAEENKNKLAYEKKLADEKLREEKLLKEKEELDLLTINTISQITIFIKNSSWSENEINHRSYVSGFDMWKKEKIEKRIIEHFAAEGFIVRFKQEIIPDDTAVCSSEYYYTIFIKIKS